MIEAVSSVVVNASLLRQSAQQGETATQKQEPVAKGPVAPYVDRIGYDKTYDTAILELRDSDTGDVLSRFPSESTLESRQRAEAARQRAETLQQSRSSGLSTPDSADASSESVSTNQTSSAETTVSSQVLQAQPQQNIGAGIAQAAIAALSTGALSTQAASVGSSVSFTA